MTNFAGWYLLADPTPVVCTSTGRLRPPDQLAGCAEKPVLGWVGAAWAGSLCDVDGGPDCWRPFLPGTVVPAAALNLRLAAQSPGLETAAWKPGSDHRDYIKYNARTGRSSIGISLKGQRNGVGN